MDSYSISIQSGNLRECMARVNLPWPYPQDPPLDGEVRRFTDPESRSRPYRNTAAWVVGYILPDGTRLAEFGSWRRESGPWHWCEAGQLSATQRAELKRLKAVAEQERQQRHAAARTLAQEIWNAATPVKGMEHPYLDKKQVPGLNAVRVTADNVLLVPLRDTEGVLHSLIRIGPDGAKKLLEDADPRGHFGAIGPKPAGAIWLTEGIATALTVAVATGATVCCGDAGNLKRVAAALRAKYPDQELIIAADLGPKGQQGAAAALGAAGPLARLLTPAHPQGDDGFDWNDLQRVAGLDEVRRQLLSAAAKAPGATATLSWPDPAPLPNEIPPAEPFLLELLPAAFRPWIADIADRLQCPADFPAIGAMVALAAVVGRKVGLRPKRFDDWLVIPNLWGCIVGRLGLLKSPALQEVMKPLQRLDREALERFDLEKVEAEALREVREAQKQVNKAKVRELLKTGGANHKEIAQLVMAVGADDGPVRRRYVVNDSTVEKLGEVLNQNPNGVLIFRDELLGWLASLEREGAEGSRQFFLEAWNGTGRFTFDRIGRGTIDIQACCLSILGSIQPGPLQDYLATAPDDGLMQRFQLAVWPDVSPDWKPVDRWPDRDAKQRVWETFKRLDALVPIASGATPGDEGEAPYLRFAADAQVEFDAWRAALETRLRTEDLHPALETVLAKHRSLVPSLALLIHLVDAPDGGPVSPTALLKACGWCEYLESHARRLYGARMTPALLGALNLARKLRRGALPEPFSLRDVYRPGWSRLTTVEAAQAAVNILLDHDWLRALAEPPPPGGGRPRTTYVINPKIRSEG